MNRHFKLVIKQVSYSMKLSVFPDEQAFQTPDQTKTHKRLKERFLIRRNRAKLAKFRGIPLFQATYKKKERQKNKQLIQFILCQLDVGGWRKEKESTLAVNMNAGSQLCFRFFFPGQTGQLFHETIRLFSYFLTFHFGAHAVFCAFLRLMVSMSIMLCSPLCHQAVVFYGMVTSAFYRLLRQASFVIIVFILSSSLIWHCNYHILKSICCIPFDIKLAS